METTTKLKYQDVAQVGDHIRSYDFYGRQDCYIEGKVTDVKLNVAGYFDFAAFVVRVDKDVWKDEEVNIGNRIGQIVHVPFETLDDYDGRIVKIS